MAHVVVTARADEDRLEILDYLADHADYQTAERYNAAFKAVYRRLAQFPASGSPRQALGPKARIALVHPYMIVYDHSGDTVTVLRILHGKRNITRRLVRRTER